MNFYYRALYTAIKWVAVAMIAVGAIIFACVLLDWFGHAGWGYPWWSLPFLIVYIAVSVIIWKLAANALRRISS